MRGNKTNHKPHRGGFIKGMIPWNKGKKGVMPLPWNLGLGGTGICKAPKTAFKHGEEHTRWKGGRTKRPNGYIYIYVGYKKHPQVNSLGFIAEHQYIWITQNPYGIWYIPKGFAIHHINGIKDDNRIENLVCISNSFHTHLHKFGIKHDASGVI